MSTTWNKCGPYPPCNFWPVPHSWLKSFVFLFSSNVYYYFKCKMGLWGGRGRKGIHRHCLPSMPQQAPCEVLEEYPMWGARGIWSFFCPETFPLVAVDLPIYKPRKWDLEKSSNLPKVTHRGSRGEVRCPPTFVQFPSPSWYHHTGYIRRFQSNGPAQKQIDPQENTQILWSDTKLAVGWTPTCVFILFCLARLPAPHNSLSC